MKNTLTSNDLQRTAFVQSLHDQIRIQAKKALKDHDKFCALASEYVDDGLDRSECLELLIVDGLTREEADQYLNMIADQRQASSGCSDYSFMFEDSHGRVWSSCDLNLTVSAANEESAWAEAESFAYSKPDLEIESIISVERID